MRSYAKIFIALGAIGALGACADSASAPSVQVKHAFVKPANFIEVGAPVVFRVDNSVGLVKRLGNHVVSIPAGAICDPETSGYGAGTWDNACDPLVGSIEITATVLQGPDGEPYVDFQPSLRFSPTRNVMLFFREGPSDGTRRMNIDYCTNGGYCYDESLTDSALAPFRVDGTSIIGRRLKHFSGYVIAYDENCLGEITPVGDGSYWCNDELGGVMRRSGYMVASGEQINDVMPPAADDKKSKDKEQDLDK